MKAKLFIYLIFIMITGCVLEHGGKFVSYIENDTTHQIELHYYKNGQENQDVYLSLNQNEIKEVLVTAGSDGLDSYPSHISGYEFDSLIVEFDNSRKAVHYNFNTAGPNPNAIMYDNPRNLFNEENYAERIIVEKKRRSEREFRYTFTEQDYLDAKE